MAKVYAMVGLPGCGKSTISQQLSKDNLAVLLSSDTIRESLYGKEEIQKNPRRGI